jgi:CHAT domain-containing protein/Tfp pilus assembly protein PilF
VAQLSGPGGEQIAEFDSESRSQGREEVSLVAEMAGAFQLIVRPKQNGAPAGSYEIRIEELRAATDADRALHEARKLYKKAFDLRLAGKYDEALPIAERALETRERELGPDHPDVAAAINNLAVLYANKGEYAKAEPLYQRALVIREKALGPEHPDVAQSLNNLAILYKSRGEFAKAEPLYQRALLIKEKAFGPDHPEVATSLNNLANVYYRKGEYSKAEPLYRRALAIWEKALGPEHPNLAASCNNLANLYRIRGDYAKAEPLHQRALAIWERALGPEHLDVATSLSNLAALYIDRGDYAKAEPPNQRALAIREKALGPEHPDVAISIANFALLYHNRGDYAKAEPLYQRALAIREKALGPEHPDVGQALSNLAAFYYDNGDYAKAEPLCRRALDIREKALGPEHPEVAHTLTNLANLYRIRGDYAKAGPLYQRALAIREKALGPEHPDVGSSLNNLAELYAAKDAIAQAITFQSRANAVSERNLTLNLATGSERQKLAYLALFSKQTDFTLWLHSRAAPNDPQALTLAFTTLLRRKGRGLDALADTFATLRRHTTPEDQTLFDQLAEARSQLAVLTLKGAGVDKPETYRARLKLLEDKVEELESALSARSAEFRAQAQPVTLAAVQAVLSAGSALVEFAAYTSQDPRTGKNRPPRYLAYLLVAQGQPKWVDLGEAAIIDRAVDAWRKALRDPNRADVKRLARGVDEKVMRPVRSILGGMPGETRRLLIAPDGSLNLIPFPALVDEQNRYLVRRYAISYLTSGRDLLRLQVSLPSKNAPLVVANPIFGGGETVATPGVQESGNSQAGDQVLRQINPTGVFLQELPGTEREAKAIKAVMPGASMLLREQATETALKQSRAPSVLHIATHGFFLGDQEAPPAETRGVPGDNPLRISAALSKWAAKVENPLLRSGLALAGVNDRRSGDDDGVLTAMEAASLDLWGTKLVVLSACNTGLGEVRNGEGVYGLRRALVLAGSETQVMSLWPVLDKQTRGMMVGYYRRLLKGEGRGEALRKIQLEMLKDAKLQHPYYWASFIQAGEWANLDGRR